MAGEGRPSTNRSLSKIHAFISEMSVRRFDTLKQMLEAGLYLSDSDWLSFVKSEDALPHTCRRWIYELS